MHFHIETLGCKVNQFESEALRKLLQERGHTAAAPGNRCDAVILNSCAVTGDASRQSRQTARRLGREYPGALLAVCGCASQISPDEMKALGARLIGGSGERKLFVLKLEKLVAAGAPAANTVVDNPGLRREIEPLPPGAPDGRTRAMIKIQDGCDNYCSYCVIPYARGHVRSLHPDEAALAATKLELQGFREIVLTGIEISSYGRDLPEKPQLEHLVTVVSRAAPAVRLRLGSLEPSTVTPRFASALREAPNLCAHFHLSLQSGSDDVLKAMRRKYNTADFFNSVTLLRKTFPNCGITADLIMGFPGETEANVLETLAFIEKCAFSKLHVFPYSRRPGTKAADMPDQIQNAEKKARAALAREIGARTSRAFLEAQIGKTLEVLFEREAGGRFYGHARNYVEVAVIAEKGNDLQNRLKSVVITGVVGDVCVGKI